MVELAEDLPIGSYTRSHLNSLRDKLLSSGLVTASARRQLSTLSALVNYVSKEMGFDPNPAFSGVIINEVEVNADSQKRPSFPIDVIKAVQQRCVEVDDEARWAVALVSDTGLRLSEALGLIKEDVILDGPVPHLVVRSHPWRRLKTSASARKVPLVGAAMWAAQRASALSPSPFLFPRYCSPEGCKGNSASGALDKWLKPMMSEGCLIHSFRHSFRDRLRAVRCPKDITDRLRGWSVAGVGESYGEGYPLEVLEELMSLLVTVTPSEGPNSTKP
jgi:integrase